MFESPVFFATYYIETSNHQRHFLDRKIIGVYKQQVFDSVNKTTFQPVREGSQLYFFIWLAFPVSNKIKVMNQLSLLQTCCEPIFPSDL